MIHVCMCMHDKNQRYTKFVGTTMLSIIQNTHEDIQFHLLHDDTLSEKNVKLLQQITPRIKFYNVEQYTKLIQLQIPKVNDYVFTVATLYRLLIPEFVNESKVIYIDADIVVNLDINELWTIDLKNYSLAAVPEYLNFSNIEDLKIFVPMIEKNMIDCKKYFNAGVMLMNLDELRRVSLFERSFEVFRKYLSLCRMLDQDALNVIFSENYLHLPVKFNLIVRNLRHYNQLKIEAGIYHYLNLVLDLNTSDNFNRLWFKYFMQTPFYNEFTFENFLQATEKIFMTRDFLWHKLLSATTKQRIFINYPQDTKNLSEYFGINDRDQILEITGNNFETDIISIVKNSTDDQFFIICVEDEIYNRIRDQLTEFKEFDKFMSPNFCFNNPILNTAELIQKM